MAELSKAHAQKMLVKEDRPHLVAMEKMKKLMQDPKEMEAWFHAPTRI